MIGELGESRGGGLSVDSAGDKGFTLIEVLIAGILLTIGLLGLAGLGVRGVQSLGEADRNSRVAATATRFLEDATEELYRMVPPTLPVQFCRVLANGDRVARAVTIQNNRRLVRVQVTVTPEPRGGVPRTSMVSSYVFLSQPIPAGQVPSGSPNC